MFRRLFARPSGPVAVDLDPESSHALQRLMDLASDQFAVAEDAAKTLASIDDHLAELVALLKPSDFGPEHRATVRVVQANGDALSVAEHGGF